jgi:hypothetical protein
MKKNWNWSLWIGFLFALAGFLSYTFFAQFPITRDFPWANFLLFAAGGICLVVGLFRAWQTADLSGQNLRTDFGHAGDLDVRFVFLRVLLRAAAGPAFDRSAASRTESA